MSYETEAYKKLVTVIEAAQLNFPALSNIRIETVGSNPSCTVIIDAAVLRSFLKERD